MPSTDSGRRATSALESGDAKYKEGDLVEYYSDSRKEWLKVTVLQADDSGRLKVLLEPGKFDLKPVAWLKKSAVETKIRPRCKPDVTGTAEAVSDSLVESDVGYKKGDLVQYYSGRHKAWLNVIVLEADDGAALSSL